MSRLESIASKYSTNDIVILGKGPSADLINVDGLAKLITIGLNDVESIAPTDVAVIHGQWAIDSVEMVGAKSSLYVIPDNCNMTQNDSLLVPHFESSSSDPDAMFRLLSSSHLAISDVLFLTGLQIAQKVAAIRGQIQTVFFVGFDFRPDEGFAKAVNGNRSGDSIQKQRLMISMQEQVFLRAKYLLEGTDLQIKHVGYRDFSDVAPNALNSRISGASTFDAGRRPNLVEITAELTTNHLGDLDQVEMMVRSAAAAGVSHVKFQMRDVDTFYTATELNSTYRSPFGTTYREYRQALELTDEQFRVIDELCAEVEVKWFASILDQASFQRARQLGIGMIKLPSTISEKKRYLMQVAQEFDGNIVVSTGMTNEDYVDWVLKTFKKQDKIYLLHTSSAYPTPNEDCNVSVVSKYRELAVKNPRIIPGYSSHDEGSLGSVLAVACGAKMVEKHVKWGNNPWIHFDAVALDLKTNAFSGFISDIREAEACLGDGVKRIMNSEHHKY